MEPDRQRPALSRRELLAATGALVAGGVAHPEETAGQAPTREGPAGADWPAAPARCVHPDARQQELWPGPRGYPWAGTGIRLWTREAILRRVGPGNLICTWTTGGFTEPGDGNFTMIARSADDGVTWSTPEVLFRHARRGLFTTELFVPASGEVHAFVQTYAPGVWMTQLQSYRAVSRDGGATWRGPHSIPGGVQNVWTNAGIVHSDGRWILPVSWAEHTGDEWCEPSAGRPPQEPRVGPRTPSAVELPWGSDTALVYRAGNDWADRNHRCAVGVLLSDDHGASFRLRGYLWRDEPRHFFEPKAVELSDGSIALLTREGTDGRLWRSDSTDGGESWSTLRRTEIPNPSSKVRLLRVRDGRIFLLHNPSGTDGKSRGHRDPLSLWVSGDDIRSWETKVDLVADPRGSLNFPDGYLDEERREVHFTWEDGKSVFLMRVPMDIRPRDLSGG